ncbi:glycosyl hydrolase 115 family protein [Verrucomicrobiaceae bacterium N1E253]|uniref:Glycosyl hydrolase 115 family protein n=1 Tax=Oceaniferula marina TaxID=2748318 RepID=A0A851GEC0_9BACT|nr:glycosyl hydrolase 115 family protein [Oceaniferula marina]NWK55262.1 glycosyl hydrolase 115 family protein [Oceaniferula marina]
MKSLASFLVFYAILTLSPQAKEESFQIVHKSKSVPIIFDRNDAEVVAISSNAMAEDIKLITGIRPEISSKPKPDASAAIIIGTLGKSAMIGDLIDRGKISKGLLDGKWETFLIQIVKNPFHGLDHALVIAGSDPRGTAFGVFELSKRLGVSPWVYWADVKPAKRRDLTVTLNQVVMGPPSVKYRGIFLNDEDWGLQPWAAKNIDTDIKDIGPKTYARIFELMLRLKANYVWPAMHKCTKAFFYYDENPKVAAQYGIVLGATHCEPMLRNNVDEWQKNFFKEYGSKPGPWRYDTNEKEIKRYWNDRVKEVADRKVDAVFTVGMRGIHDGKMPGPKSTTGKIKLMDKVIKDQRNMIAEHFKRDFSEIPQIFCPYKEVLQLYQQGAEVPEDVTIVWADDNHGYIRQLSTPEEQKRSGRSGVYYHLSYWGPPEDYLWLSSVSPTLISYEMNKAYAYGADRLWVFNVGDIKPAELETEFAMDLAWDIEAWPPEEAADYVEQWAARTLGQSFAGEVAEIKAEYYRLAASGKPEHINLVSFSEQEAGRRLEAYQAIERKAIDLKKRIPAHLQNAYFQLIYYPVICAAKMNEKHLYARMGDHGRSQDAHSEIKKLTQAYNKELAGGKWDGMMSMNPRNRPVFGMPKIQNRETPQEASNTSIKTINVSELQFDSSKLQVIRGLGVDGESLSRIRFDGLSYEDAGNAPTASIRLNLPAGLRRIKLVCVPTHAIHEGRSLRCSVKIDGRQHKVLDVNSGSKSKKWTKNVIRGYSSAEVVFDLKKGGSVDLQLALLDPGLAISSIVVY